MAPYTWDRTAGALLQLFRETKRQTETANEGRQKTPDRRTLLCLVSLGAQPEHWNENKEFASVTDFPKGGPYSSTNPALIRRHLQTATDAGLDFFVVNLQVSSQGLNPTEMEGTRESFKPSKRKRIPQKCPFSLASASRIRRLSAQPSRRCEKNSWARPLYQTSAVAAALVLPERSLHGLFLFPAEGIGSLESRSASDRRRSLIYNKFLPRLLRKFFSGWCLYSPLEVGPLEIREALCTKGYVIFTRTTTRSGLYRLVPGYDDSRIQSYERMHSRRRIGPGEA